MSDKTISLPEEHYTLATEAAERHGFQNVSEYVSKLIEIDVLVRDGMRDRHEPLLRETLEKDNRTSEFTQADWDELRERAKRVAATGKRATA
jgi:Arc/MetJ-type ribon-helix-helix transcriptional regulator